MIHAIDKKKTRHQLQADFLAVVAGLLLLQAESGLLCLRKLCDALLAQGLVLLFLALTLFACLVSLLVFFPPVGQVARVLVVCVVDDGVALGLFHLLQFCAQFSHTAFVLGVDVASFGNSPLFRLLSESLANVHEQASRSLQFLFAMAGGEVIRIARHCVSP